MTVPLHDKPLGRFGEGAGNKGMRDERAQGLTPDGVLVSDTGRWPEKARLWHEAIMDELAVDPTISIKTLSVRFRISANWISAVVNSDMFQARLRERRGDIEGTVLVDIKQKLESVAHLGLDALADRLTTQTDTIPMKELRNATDSALRALGFGGGGKVSINAPNGNVQVNVVDPGVLADARRRLQSRTEGMGGNARPSNGAPALVVDGTSHPMEGAGLPSPTEGPSRQGDLLPVSVAARG